MKKNRKGKKRNTQTSETTHEKDNVVRSPRCKRAEVEKKKNHETIYTAHISP